MGKLVTLLLFLTALIYVVFPQSTQNFQNEAKKEINFWGIYDLPEIYSPIIDEFKKSHPEIEIVYTQFANAEEYGQVLLRQLKKGKGPDIFLFNDQNRAEYVDYINPTSSEYLEGFPAYVGEKLATNKLLFGIPIWVDSLVFYYNKIYYPEGLKANWYEFAEQTKKINISGIAMGRLDNLRSGWDMLKVLFLQKDVKVSGKPENNLYDVLEFFTRFAYPIDRYFNWNEKLSNNYPDKEVDSFVRGKVAAIAGYSSLNNFITTKIGQLQSNNIRGISSENVGIAAFPQFSIDKPRYLAKYTFLGVSLQSKTPNEAWEFIRLLTNETNASYYQQATGRTTGRLMASMDSDSELQKIQKQQLPDSSAFYISPPAQKKIEEIVTRSIKDKRVLKEILEISL